MTFLTYPIFWIALAVVTILVDFLFIGLVYPTIIGIALFITGVVCYFTDNILVILLFLIVSNFLSYYILAPSLNKLFKKETLDSSNVYSMVGKEAKAIEPISPEKNGYVLFNGEEWLASSNMSISKDDTVIIEKVEGATLIVSSKFV